MGTYFRYISLLCCMLLSSSFGDHGPLATENSVDCLSRLAAAGLAPVWLQYGEARTTSTLQLRILTAYGWLICGEQVSSHYLMPSAEPTFEPGKLMVIKTHRPGSWKDITRVTSEPIDTFISGLTLNTSVPEELALHTRVRFIQSRSELERNGVTSMLLQYAPLFGFNASSPRVVHAARWLELWSITRICCGSQMSAEWRKALHKLRRKPLERMPPGTHECQSYNLTHVEEEVLAVQQAAFGHVKDDWPVEVGWCERSIQATIKFRLKFNAPKYVKLRKKPFK